MSKIIIFFIIFLTIFIVLLVHLISKSYKIKYDNFTFFEGSLGSGKTSTITTEGLNELFKRLLYNCFIANKFNNFIFNLFIYFIPFYNIFHIIKVVIILFKKKKFFYYPIKKRGVDLYTNYPVRYRKYIIFGKWIYSKVIDMTLFNWLIKYNEDCIIILDELGFWFPPTTNSKGSAIMTDKVNVFGLTWLRHAITPCVFCASQSIDEVNISFRRKIQHIYRLSDNKKVFFRLSKVNIIEIQRSEDSGNIITTFNDSDKEHINNYHYYLFPKNNFNSRYGRKLYYLSENDINLISHNYDELLNYMGLKPKDYWKSLEFEGKD